MFGNQDAQVRVPLQAAQDSMYKFQQFYPQGSAYNRSVAVEIDGAIDLDILQKALELVIERHEVLRSQVKKDEKGCFLDILPAEKLSRPIGWPLKLIDATHLPTIPLLENLPETLKQLHHEDFLGQRFKLEKEPLWRAAILKLPNNKFQFTMLFHHIIVDEGSIGVIFKDLSACYNALKSNQKVDLPPIPSLAKINLLTDEEEAKKRETEVKKRLDYWKEKLKDLTPVNLETDSTQPDTFKFAGKRLPFRLEKEFVAKLEALASANKVSLNTILLSVLYSLLYRYSGETDICIGITSANRRQPNVSEEVMKNLVNCFFNSIALRTSLNKEMSFDKLFAQVNETVREGLKNQLPLTTVTQEALMRETRAALRTASPFDVLLVLNEKKPTLTFIDTTASYPKELDLGTSKFSYFGFNFDRQYNDSFECFLEYNSDIFTQETMEFFIGHFKKSLEHLIQQQAKCKISSVPLLLEEEVNLINKFNQTESKKVSPHFVHDVFHQVAMEKPSHTMIAFHDEDNQVKKLTYGESDLFTTQLANYLKQFTLSEEKTVGICLHRSPNLYNAIFGVLKAGDTFITMETDSQEAIKHKIANSKVSLVIVDNETKKLFAEEKNVTVLNIEDKATLELISACKTDYTPPLLKSIDPAYIMYTSGSSTASEKPEPKGVILTHGGFVNLLWDLTNQKLTPESKIISTALSTFDAFLFDVLYLLATSGQIHLAFEKGRYSPGVINTIIEKEKINFGAFLPELLSNIKPQLFKSFTDVISMGAAPHEEILDKCLQANPNNIRVRNGYGLTETGICVTLQDYSKGLDPSLIGKPISNMQILILTESDTDTFNLCPLGVPGQIFTCGPGNALGYIGENPNLSKKFISVTYDAATNCYKKCSANTEGAIKLYATGDVGCYKHLKSDNTLAVKFMGRNDRQVKINGTRIKLDFIEAALRNHPRIKDIVIHPNKENTSLIAYIVPHDQITLEEMRTIVQETLAKTLLPSVAYPHSLVLLPNGLPTTKNGKIDLRSLPAPEKNVQHRPLTPLQNVLLDIWAKVLGCPKEFIDISEQTWKQLGGDSLGLSTLEAKINDCKELKLTKEIGIQILSLKMTLESLANAIKPFIKPIPLIALPPNVKFTGQHTIVFKSKPQESQSKTGTNNQPHRPPSPHHG